MKIIKPLVIVFLLICSSSFGQTGKLKRADRLFDSFSFTKAIDKYENVVNKNGNDSYAMRKLGDSYMYLRMPEKAVEAYKTAITLKPTYHRPHLQLGNICYKQERISQALMCFNVYMLLTYDDEGDQDED